MILASVVFVTQVHAMEEETALLPNMARVIFKNKTKEPVTVEASIHWKEKASNTTNTKRFKIRISADETKSLDKRDFTELFKSGDVKEVKFDNATFCFSDSPKIEDGSPLYFRTIHKFKKTPEKNVVETSSF